MRKLILLSLIPAALFLVTAAACGDDDDDDDGNGGETTAPDGNGDGEGTDVDITLQEFNVIPSPASAAAGTVNFNIQNDGPDDPHEFVVIKTDLSPDALPTAEDGSVDEAGEGIDEIVDEIEDLEVGDTATLTVDLEAGAYALICNIVEEEEGEVESHYQEGMRVGFTVE